MPIAVQNYIIVQQKSIEDGKEFYRCSQYKEKRGSCTIHFIRDAVLKEIVLETVKAVAKYVTEFEPVFFICTQSITQLIGK